MRSEATCDSRAEARPNDGLARHQKSFVRMQLTVTSWCHDAESADYPAARRAGQALRTYAFVTHTSANGIVEAALTEYLNAHAHTDIVRARFDKALHLHAVAFEKLEC